MKNTFFKFAVMIMIAIPAIGHAQSSRTRMGIGPVEKIEITQQQLPRTAQTFINDLFPSVAIKSITNDLLKKEYEVDLANNYEITFDKDGNWTEIEAPDNAMFPRGLISRLITDSPVVEVLKSDEVYPGGIIDFIESVTYIPDYGYIVEYEVTDYTNGEISINKSGDIKKENNKKHNVCHKGKRGKHRH